MNQLILSLYFFIVIFIGYSSYKKIRGSRDYFVAGKEAGVREIAGSLLATVLGSSAIIGSINFSYINGWAGSWFMLCAALGLLGLLPLIDKLNKYKSYNLPELMGEFYGNEVKTLSSTIIPIAWIGIVAAQIMGSAKIVSIFVDMNYSTAVIISGLVFIAYTFLGGQLSIIKTDFIQFLFIIAGVILCFAYTLKGGGNMKGIGMINENFNSLDLFIMILTYSSTFLVGPDIYSRIFCAKDEKTAKQAIKLSIIILIPLGFILAGIGVYVSSNYGVDVVKGSVLMFLADKVLPQPIVILLYFGLLSAVISSADTTLLTASSTFAQIFIKDLRDENAIRLTRVFILIFGLFSILVALQFTFILPTLLLALAVYSGAFIVPCLSGILGYRCEKKYALSGILVGGGLALYGKLMGGSTGNIIIISSFLINLIILIIPKLKKSIDANS
ncbi:sodium:solute symporter family protein [Psychrilyobacter atlanticus]|uniref:sodium:solute symporter family protein n=1 Tax=Psychrilyobacter atlanticus TaxID=271091 RepID=UPI000421F899|nr:sodium:solute symporter family protein [Psychrilyobacter atlanticus]